MVALSNAEVLSLLKAPSMPQAMQVALTHTILLKTQCAYKHIASHYKKERPKLSPIEVSVLDGLYQHVRKAFKKEKLHILDIGAGHGLELNYLQKRINTYCLAIEYTPKFIEIGAKSVKYICAEMMHVPLAANSQHIILHHAALHHLPLLTEGIAMHLAMAETLSLLKKGGMVDIIHKYGDMPFFDKNGRFFHPFNEKTAQKFLSAFPVKIHTLKKIEIPSPKPSWSEWLHIRLEKLG